MLAVSTSIRAWPSKSPPSPFSMAARAAESSDDDAPLTADDLARRIRDHLGERAARVDLVLPATGLALRVPGEQLVQAVVALIRNALDASAPDGRVTVELGERAGGVHLSVIDRGAGIPWGNAKRRAVGVGERDVMDAVQERSEAGTLYRLGGC